MDRRQFLYKTVGVGTLPLFAQSASATEPEIADFGKLVTTTYTGLPKNKQELEPALMDIAETIHTEFSKLEWEDSNQILSEIGGSDKAARRLEFLIEILHNHGLADYLDEAWVAAFRNNISSVTRILPLLGSFNNLYHAAKTLDKAADQPPEPPTKQYDTFAFALIAFCLEVGLFYISAPYKMAWKGTRFVSNRTLLRTGRWVDNRIIGFAMSELHWKIRSGLYEHINKNSIGSVFEYSKSLADRVKELEQFAKAEVTDKETGEPYVNTLSMDVHWWEISKYDFVKKRINKNFEEEDIEGKITASKNRYSSKKSDGDESSFPFKFSF